MSRYRALIVEDEAHARQNLKDYLRGVEWIEVVGEAGDGNEAIELFGALKPDLVFLDVRLPELSGIEVAQRIGSQAEIVFTTAYDRFAIAAFEIGALDYLVKPFGRERFATALERLKARRSKPGDSAAQRARTALGEGPLARLYARHGDGIVPIPVGSIARIQARGDYAEIHAGSATYLLHISLAELEGRLDPARFQRVHRSHVVNLDFVKEMRSGDDRRLRVTLRDGTEIVASRTASLNLRKLAR